LTHAERLANLTPRDRELNSFALRSFRDIADGDYIAARTACRAQLPVQFLWASQQALEKYLKCILFLHRVEATDVKHNLRRALELIENGGIDLDLNEYSRKFIEDVDDVGQYRYLEASFNVNWQKIMILDRCVWELRRFCTLDMTVRAKKLVEGKMPPRIRLGDSAFMEQVLDDKKHPAREALIWQNGYVGRSRRIVRLRGGFAGWNSPMLRVKHLIDDITRLAWIPKAVVTAYRENVWNKKP
jgi:HEPN domain-containing protein